MGISSFVIPSLLLCREKNDAVVKLTLPKDANIHAKEYQLYYPKGATPSHLLSWSHYVELLGIKDPAERGIYIIEATNSGWNVRELR